MNRREFLVAAGSLPLTLRLAPESLAGGTPIALVTADLESRIAVVEVSAGRILRFVPTLPGPRSIERVGATAVVAHTAVGAVTLLDGRSLEIRQVLRSFDEPRYTAAAPDGRHAFVTDSGSAGLVVVDVVRRRVVARLRLSGWPRHLSLDPGGRTLWIALGTEARAIAVVDVSEPARPRLTARIKPPFLGHDVGFAPGGRHVWVTSGDRGRLAVYDARRGTVVRRLPAGAPPQHVTFYGGAVYVTSGGDGTLRVQSRRDGRILRTTGVPIGSYNVQQGWRRILTPSLDRGTLCVLDTRGRLLRSLRVAASSHDACFMTRV
jgi:DNA-binding beta-propeller fold protein YncE